jgi:hypothetical protein
LPAHAPRTCLACCPHARTPRRPRTPAARASPPAHSRVPQTHACERSTYGRARASAASCCLGAPPPTPKRPRRRCRCLHTHTRPRSLPAHAHAAPTKNTSRSRRSARVRANRIQPTGWLHGVDWCTSWRGGASETASENIPRRNSAEMRFARKASRRPSHARVPGFTRPFWPGRQPAGARLFGCNNVVSCVAKWNAPASARRSRPSRKGLVPLRSNSRTCKSCTVPFSKAPTMSSIDSSPDARPCKMQAGGATQRDRRRHARTLNVVDQARRFAVQAAHVLRAYGVRRAADSEARADEPLFTPETCAAQPGHWLARPRVLREGVARCPAHPRGLARPARFQPGHDTIARYIRTAPSNKKSKFKFTTGIQSESNGALCNG